MHRSGKKMVKRSNGAKDKGRKGRRAEGQKRKFKRSKDVGVQYFEPLHLLKRTKIKSAPWSADLLDTNLDIDSKNYQIFLYQR